MSAFDLHTTRDAAAPSASLPASATLDHQDHVTLYCGKFPGFSSVRRAARPSNFDTMYVDHGRVR